MIGLLSYVQRDTFSSRLVADAAAGATTLFVEQAQVFDVNGGTVRLGEATMVAYTTADAVAETVTLAAGLPAAFVTDTPVVEMTADGEKASWTAYVSVDPDSADTLPATIPDGLVQFFREGEVQAGTPVEFGIGPDGFYRVTSRPDQPPVIDGTLIDPTTLPPSDGTPTTAPDSSPTPTVFASSGAMSVVVPAPADSRTRLNMYLAPRPASGDPAADETTLFTDDAKGVVVTFEQSPGGTPLDPAVTYSVAIEAYNVAADGTILAAALSPWVDGSPAEISPLFIAQTALVEALRATTVDAVTLTGAKITADELVSQGVLRIFGGADSTLSGTLIAALGVTTPTAPMVTMDWPLTAFTLPNARTLCDDGSQWLTVRPGSGTRTAFAINKTTGQVTTLSVTNMADRSMYGITKVGTSYWILYFDSNLQSYGCSRHTLTGSALVFADESNFAPTSAYYTATPTIGTDGTYVFIAGQGAGDTNNPLRVARLNNGVVAGDWQVAGQSIGALSGLVVTSADFGASRMLIAGSVVKSFAQSGGVYNSVQPSESFPLAAACYGLAYADGAFASLTYGAGVYRYTGNRAGTTDYAITWRDDDSGGAGTAETKSSARKTVTVNRQRVNVTLPSLPPDDGTSDGANTATIYAAPAGGALVPQTDLTEAQAKSGDPVRYTTAPSTTTVTNRPPATSGFEGRPGGIGRYQSAAGDAKGALAQLNGNGSFRLAGANLDDLSAAAITITSGAAGSPAPTAGKTNGRAVISGTYTPPSGWAANTVYPVGTLPAGTYPKNAINRPCSANRVAVNVNGIVSTTGTVSIQTGASLPTAVDLSALSGYLCAS